MPRERDHDDEHSVWSPEAGRFIVPGQWVPEDAPPVRELPENPIYDPQPFLAARADAAFLASGRISASRPAPVAGRFHHRMQRRG